MLKIAALCFCLAFGAGIVYVLRTQLRARRLARKGRP